MDHRRDGAIAAIRRLSRVAGIAATLGMLLLASAMAAGFGFLIFDSETFVSIISKEVLREEKLVRLPLWASSLLILIMTAPTLLGLFGLARARQLFASYGRGEIFSAGAAKRLQSIGWVIIVLAPLGLLTNVAAAALLSGIGTGALEIQIGLSRTDVIAVICGLMFVVVGRILNEAARISDEHLLFV